MFTSVPRTAMAAEVCRSEPKSRNLLLGSWDRWCMSSRLIEPRTFCPFPDPPCTTVIIMKRKWTLHSQSRLTSSVKSMACVDQRKKVRRGSFSFSRKWPTMGGHFFFFFVFGLPFYLPLPSLMRIRPKCSLYQDRTFDLLVSPEINSNGLLNQRICHQ